MNRETQKVQPYVFIAKDFAKNIASELWPARVSESLFRERRQIEQLRSLQS